MEGGAGVSGSILKGLINEVFFRIHVICQCTMIHIV